jgi:formylglycine-generating enzyme required for sulfatase activity
MGSDDHYPEERPARLVEVSDFLIERAPVTNASYLAFVAETGYVTVAERPLDPDEFPGAPAENLVPGSMVLRRTARPVDLRHLSLWWAWTPGACWRHPEGVASNLEGRADHPVVHVAFEDARAYATWAARDLPTEAEWERAARGGREGAVFVWGDDHEAEQPLANYWHGDFPWRSAPGYGTTSTVGAYPANDYGLFDMAGNVWEWTLDWYAESPEATGECCVPRDPRGGDEAGSRDSAQPQFAVPRRVVKGGSFLCADSYCMRYRPAARRPQAIDTGMSHIGFRCVAHG